MREWTFETLSLASVPRPSSVGGLVVTAIPATFAQNDGETVTHEYQDRAASHISEVWYKGETLEISGEGFLTQDRASGSTIAIKLNKGAIKIDGRDYLEVTANDKGRIYRLDPLAERPGRSRLR